MTDKTIKMYKIVNNIIIECAPDNSDKSQLDIIHVCVRVRLSSVTCNSAKVGAYANVSPFSGDL